ncbi:nuclear transport factor 2 family protein [Bacteroides gallinaceum]|uniref:nuclear transport factor 2 family protein n=1 Tax=Bacteroides gallinaceum TaxID=1462571 RepID=UPI0025A38C68|nr:nuclear transport factor 2 family protein [Bacteroides gallinaceum]MDM8208604.1 nuclear transport factor 2 family protein [Bacteroides gallinaceum]
MDEKSIKEEVIRTIEYYIEGARQCDDILFYKAFDWNATMSWAEDGSIRTVPIEELLKFGQSMGKQEVDYKLTVCSATEDTAIARIESHFNKAGTYTDMFTLVKGADGWKIVSKIYHLYKKN